MDNFSLSRRSALVLGTSALLMPRLAGAEKLQPVLIELFTSQGCSSCPPADELAAELVDDPNAIVLSFNVDYWDYLGWRDTLAKPEYTQRQYDYAKSRGDGSVYTPQMIMNGAAHVVGSRRQDVLQAIEKSRARLASIEMTLALTQKSISVEIPASTSQEEATLWLMAVEPRVIQKVERGENTGKDITYVNVVRNLVPAGMWNGSQFKGSWTRDTVMTKDTTQLIAVLQKNKVGEVIGVARA